MRWRGTGAEYQMCIPPACRRLVAFEATVALLAAVMPKSFWKDCKVKTPPITPVSYLD